MIRKIITIHNQLSDKSVIWFPFVFLKPRPEVLISLRHTLVMTFCFAAYFALLYQVKQFLFGSGSSLEEGLRVFGWSLLGFFCWFRLVTVPFWNIRARELSDLRGEANRQRAS